MSSEPNSDSARGRSFALRINLWFAATTTAMALALFFVAYLMLSASVAQKDREVIVAQLDLYRSWYEDGGLAGLNRRFSTRPEGDQESFFIRVAGPGGAALFIRQPSGSRPPNLGAITPPGNAGPAWTRLPTGVGEGPWLLATVELRDGHWLQVGKTTVAHQLLLDLFRAVAAWVVALGLFLGLLAGALLSRSVLRPVRRLLDATRRVLATGDMDARVPVRDGPGDELHQLTVLFNAMLAKNDTLLGGMREALDNVAHDLRTPLTRLRGSAERTLTEPPGPGDREAVSDALEETESVLLLLDTLTDISEAETGLMRLEKSDIPLAALAAEAVDLYEMVAEDRGIEVAIDIAEDATAFADPQRLRQALVNLLDNALKYTPGGGTVTIFAETREDKSVLGVRDTGPGIPPDEMPRIWERLYRGDKSRSERGLGLGLALVSAIAKAHGGSARVENAPESGAVFSLTFPQCS
jgi:signal transduction histidine kinase